MQQDEIDRLAEQAMLLTVMGHERRLLVLRLLQQSEMSVGTLSVAVGMAQSALSQHLAKLRRSRLVQTRRSGQMIYYRCNDVRVSQILATLDALCAGKAMFG